jgi:hypothetical protein
MYERFLKWFNEIGFVVKFVNAETCITWNRTGFEFLVYLGKRTSVKDDQNKIGQYNKILLQLILLSNTSLYSPLLKFYYKNARSKNCNVAFVRFCYLVKRLCKNEAVDHLFTDHN